MILLIEDNEEDELLTLRAFKKNNIANELVVVRDGAEALDFLFIRGKYKDRNPRKQPQLILLDLKLPKISGLDVLKEIRSNPQTQLLPVVILTSSSQEMDILNGYKNGANAFIRKPVNFEQFCEAIKSLGLFWLIMNKIPKME
jgi:CheY-like chemotaxis protein